MRFNRRNRRAPRKRNNRRRMGRKPIKKFTSRVRSIVKKKTGAVTYDTTFLCQVNSAGDTLLNQPIELFVGTSASNFPYTPRYWMLDISRTLCSTNQSAVSTGNALSYTRTSGNGLVGWPGHSTATTTTQLNARCSAVLNGAKYIHENTRWNFFVRNDNVAIGMRIKVYILECKTTAIDTAKFFQGVGPPTFPEWATLKYERSYMLSPKPPVASAASNFLGAQSPMTWCRQITGSYTANKPILDSRTAYEVTAGGTTETRDVNEKGHLFMLLGWSYVAADPAAAVNNAPFCNGYIRSKYRDTI